MQSRLLPQRLRAGVLLLSPAVWLSQLGPGLTWFSPDYSSAPFLGVDNRATQPVPADLPHLADSHHTRRMGNWRGAGDGGVDVTRSSPSACHWRCLSAAPAAAAPRERSSKRSIPPAAAPHIISSCLSTLLSGQVYEEETQFAPAKASTTPAESAPPCPS